MRPLSEDRPDRIHHSAAAASSISVGIWCSMISKTSGPCRLVRFDRKDPVSAGMGAQRT